MIESSNVPLYFQLLYIIVIIYESSHGKVGLPNTMLTNGFQMYLFLTFIILKRKLNIIFCIWPKAYEICIVSLIECIWTLTNGFDYCATPHIKLVSSLATSKIVLRWLITISDLNVLLHLPLHNWQKWRLEELVRFSYGYWNPWVRFMSNRFVSLVLACVATIIWK